MRHDIYWMLPGDGRTYRALPEKQIDGQPIPTTWAGVGPAKAKELGAVECRRDVIPPYHSIPDGVDPWATEDVDGVRVYSLDVSKLVHDEAAETVALAEQVRLQRAEKLNNSDRAVLALERRIRLGGKVGNDVSVLEEKLAQWDAYRETLCALPDVDGFPQDVHWPEKPE